MNDSSWSIFVVLLVLLSFILVGLRQKSRESHEYGFGGRYTGRIGGGAAIASNWMSAASLMGLAGIIYLRGYQGLAYVIGWTGGYVLLLVLLASQIRRFGKFTTPEFVGERYGSPAARLMAAVIAIAISVIYCVAQFKGIGLIFAFMFDIGYEQGVTYGALAVVSYLVISGALGVPRNQQLQYLVICVAFIVPLMWLAKKLGYFWLLPQFGYGRALTDLAREFRIDFTLPFAGDSLFEWCALCFTLMVGTGGLPHVLSRFYTVPNVRDARWSVVWGLFFIALIYWSAPAFAVFGRLLEARHGIAFAPDTARAAADVIALKTALMAGLPGWLVGVLAAGALSAAFFTVAGLLMTGAASISHDLYYSFVNPKASETARMQVAKGGTLVLAALVLLVALNPPGLIAEITAVAFALAGNTIFPLFLLGIWWDRANRYGAIAGMVTGVLCTVAAPLLGGILPGVASYFPVTASALCGAPLVICVMIAVSLATPAPPEEMRRFLEQEVHGHLD
ncbi:VC_2705 family sodium/solute symporter [Geomonas paludis]|uniref:VC_2705 family sodium/solute symporter n=1 Tax=Geomonas paludis TaxID=2740185 RepID=A0ABY4LHR4_9BACT|nr:VC_2705 family sodium/solute symporter [Geomonas paludis]UPU37535.1 VC_2705 family sodium/solute symporter [Geomonas paludis]